MQPASPYPMMHHSPMSTESVANSFFTHSRVSSLANIPHYIKPLPARIGPDEAAYLEKKGALTIPAVALRNELLKAYIEFVHPYMPLIDLYELIMIVESGNGVLGRISLILFQSVMFAGCAFVDMQHLYSAGYLTRKDARKDFFQKTRVCFRFPRTAFEQLLILDDSCCTTLTTNRIEFPSCKHSYSSLTITKLRTTRKIHGIGWASQPRLLTPLAYTEILSVQT